MNIHIVTNIHTYKHINTHRYIYTFPHVLSNTYLLVCTCIYASTYKHHQNITCININTSTHIYTYAHTQTNNAFACKHAHLDGYSLHSSHTCVHMDICTCVHMDVCTPMHTDIKAIQTNTFIKYINLRWHMQICSYKAVLQCMIKQIM